MKNYNLIGFNYVLTKVKTFCTCGIDQGQGKNKGYLVLAKIHQLTRRNQGLIAACSKTSNI
ncbi:hypothetical protein HanPSC8_Chr03g0085731 [Helianthus annuus]|nr:hypothetical protein HanPSC8_Chr03g0085731 [Helianthus annuus]